MQFISIALAQNSTGGQIVQTVADQYNFDFGNIFGWSIALGGALALGVIIYGGLLWSTSGFLNKKEEGLEWIKAAILGLFLLIGAYMLLNTINPELLKF